MKRCLLGEQAADLTNLLPRLMRAIFTLDGNDPTMELPVAQLRVCNLLHDGPRTISALARELRITVSAVTQIADRLESADLVERLAGKKDRRTRNLRLTGRGAEVLRSRRQGQVRRALEVLSLLAPTDRAKALKALAALLAASAGAASTAADGETRRRQANPGTAATHAVP
jgi:DNA-binding MarR family transcriptional regulator